MRVLRIIPLLITITLVWLLDTSMGGKPPLGRFLDPLNGGMSAAEDVEKNFSQKISIKGLKEEVIIDLEDRLVPHITAKNDHDLYMAQGYIHAYFRLWQMDMQTRAAAGRISEVAGKKAFKFDQGQRRKGMIYAAENSLKAMEAEPHTKEMLDAYTAGINNFIKNLSYRDLPLEYKLMNFKPEPWTNIRCALMLKYMADDLTGASDDIAYTLLRDQLGKEQFDFLFPEKIKGSKPVIPEGTKFDPPSLKQPAYPGDSVWAHFSQKLAVGGKQFNSNPESEIRNPESESGIGSNNWAISGKHTASGAPILCNDPHLGLNLPSLWFEMQLTAPGINSYGVSLPSAPGIIIGFNEHISWGFTNNYRDVKDYFAITAKGRESYLFDGKQHAFSKRVERILIKDSVEVMDTVLYTIHGPVQYDDHFPDPMKTGQMMAMCWMAHRPTNELLAIYELNRANNYETYTKAIQHFECPAQNFVYADKLNNIAMWGQGQFINKWRGQGKFVMEGQDSRTLWGQNIPMNENPHVLNPEQGYVASANQNVTDSTYPYWYNGSFTEWRSWAINEQLAQQGGASLTEDPLLIPLPVLPMDMESFKQLQNDDYSLLVNKLKFHVLDNCFDWHDTIKLNIAGYKYDVGQSLIEFLHPENISSSLYQIWWSQLYKNIWQDDFPQSSVYPLSERTIQLLLDDSTSKYYDDKRTQQIETLKDIVQRSFKETTDSLEKLKPTGLEWYKVKNTSLTHLAKLPAFSYTQLKTGGWGNTINAMKGNHGPSWRMIVEMDKEIKAYGIYPGGQSGNPGSIHYGDNIDQWVEGKYNELKFVTSNSKKPTFKHKITLSPS